MCVEESENTIIHEIKMDRVEVESGVSFSSSFSSFFYFLIFIFSKLVVQIESYNKNERLFLSFFKHIYINIIVTLMIRLLACLREKKNDRFFFFYLFIICIYVLQVLILGLFYFKGRSLYVTHFQVSLSL